MGAQEAMAPAENSVNSSGVRLFSLFLLEKLLLFKPPDPNKLLACHTAQPVSVPKVLQQTLHPWPRASATLVPVLDLLVLKHSSYHLIFQCSVQFLVSNLHICWNTIGCSLCSSDQLGLSLVPRGKSVSYTHLTLPTTT